jgi:hypothetical protein
VKAQDSKREKERGWVKRSKSNPTSIKAKTILKENDTQKQSFFGGEFSPNGDLFTYLSIKKGDNLVFLGNF